MIITHNNIILKNEGIILNKITTVPPTPPSPFANTYSLDFDGVDDYVDVGNVIDKDKSNAFSISVWINIPLTISNNIIISKVEDRDNGGALSKGAVGYQLYFNNTLYFRFLLDSHFSHQMYVQDANYWGLSDGLINGWHHIVGTYDGSGLSSGMTLYVDGYDVSFNRVDIGTGDFNNTGDLYVGGQNYNGTPQSSFRGKIDEPCIIPTELTPAEVLDIYNGIRPSGGGVVDGNWNDGTGKPKDMSSYNSDLWLRNGDNGSWKSPQWLLPNNENKDKVSNYSFDFDGIDDKVTLSSSVDLGINSTISLWVNLDSGFNGVIIGETSYAVPYILYVRENVDFVVRIDNVFKYYTQMSNVASGGLASGSWNNIVIQRSGDVIECFLNGVSKGTQSGFGTSVNTLFDTFGGEPPNLLYQIEGKIDEIAAWNTNTIDPIDIYNGGEPTTLPSGAIAHYRMGEESNFTSNWLVDNSALDNYSKRSFAFDGLDDYIDLGDISALNNTTNFTYSGWYKQPILDVRGTMLSSGYLSSNQEFILFYTWNDGRMILQIGDSGVNPYASFDYSLYVTAGQWFHFAYVYNGNGITEADKVQIYINGASITLTFSGTMHTSTPVGANITKISSTTTDAWGGGVDEAAFFDYSLNATEVLSIYNGDGAATPGDLTSLSPTNWWRMGEDASFNGTDWTVPDQVGTNNGTSNGMMVDSLVGEAPNYSGGGISNGMTIEDRVGNAPNSDNNALSINMEREDRVEDTP